MTGAKLGKQIFRLVVPVTLTITSSTLSQPREQESSEAALQPAGIDGKAALRSASRFYGRQTALAGQHAGAVDHSAGWPRPRSDGREDERRFMVRRHLAARDITDKDVLDAMLNVPRHWFVPERIQPHAYADRPLQIGERQTISQPYIVAFMTQALALNANSKVLEVGTGSGYQAAVLAEITPHIYSIEIVEPLARRAKATFEKHGYGTIKVRVGDGYAGWKEHAPFDAIIVTCAPDHIPPALIEQLKSGGKICIPVGRQTGAQWLRLVTKSADGKLTTSDLLPVRFVPMTGNAQKKRSND